MKFDFVIGNPPYQEMTEGTSDRPVYNDFMDAAYTVADKVELITPARFLFNAGKTPKAWNEKMLADPHLKVSFYEQDSSKIFGDTEIKGGIAITYRDVSKEFGAIGAFSVFGELNSLLRKVVTNPDFETLDDIIVQQNKWNLMALYEDYPEYRSIIGSNGTEKRLTTPIFSALDVFKESPSSENELKILGLIRNKRFYRYVNKKYIDLSQINLFKYKVILPASTGSGALGEAFSSPEIGTPGEGYTQSFIGFGAFESESEANAAYKYIKCKFVRALLGTLKVTQHNHKGTWKHVPTQDFTSASDIDWSQSIRNIDQQLYKKYGLTKEEIDFIETHVQEMS